jgi:hypothetical protein
MWNKCGIVMLPINEKAKEDNDTIYLNHYSQELILGWKNARSTNQTIQNLYITSDEEIKEGDYTIYCNIWLCRILKHFGDQVLILKLNDNKQTTVLIPEHKKIIASTNTSLEYIKHELYPNGNTTGVRSLIELPQLPKQFINYFIEEYNKGNVISKVDVEYTYDNPELNKNVLLLKVNPDNTINIKPINNLHTNQEIRDLFWKFMVDNNVVCVNINFDKWFNENL